MPDNDKLLNAIDGFEQRSYGGDQDGELQQQRALSIEYYLGNNLEPGADGRSQVVDRSVFETVQWILPSLCRIFASGDNVVEFEPLGQDDEEAALQESDFLNYLVTQKNDWFKTVVEWFQDALTTKNAYCMAYIDERVKVEKDRYERQSELQVTHLMEGDGVELVAHSAYPDEDAEPQMVPMLGPDGQPMIDPNTGQPVPAVDEMGQVIMEQPMLHDVEIKQSKAEGRLAFKVLPPERVKIAEQTTDFTLNECPYFEYWDRVTISDLRAQGFEVEDDISTDDEADTEEDDARDQYLQGETQRQDEFEIDPAMRRVKARTVWIKHDYDEDGIAELQRVVVVGRTVLDRREESRIPVASIVPFMLTHRHIGLSLVDAMGDIQRIMTAVLRQGLDNLYISNNPRPFVNEDRVNLDDVLISRPGAPVRSLPGKNAQLGVDFGYLEVPFVFPQAINALEYMDSVKEKRTGLNKNFTGATEDALSGNASGVAINQVSTMAAQRVEQIARMFACGVEYLFSVSHELLLKHGHKKESIKLRGNWVDIDPSTWKTGRDLRISVTYGAGNKDALASRLGSILQTQMMAGEKGYRIATEKDVYEAAMDLAKASDLPNKFFSDPSKLPPPTPPPNPIEVGAQVEQMKNQTDQVRIKSDAQQKDQDRAQRQHESDQDIEIKKYEIDRRVELDWAKAQLLAGKDVDIARMKST